MVERGDRAQRRSAGRARRRRRTSQLGYLLGAAQRGAEDTEGIHAELIRRLTAAARYSPGQPAARRRPSSRLPEGFDAGHARLAEAAERGG